ncbi:site-specific DNA-methyltransferase [Comamonas sp. J-3]|uniref:site-specific DNA-methyltransferase n=1 Tax=Comamonas trifloxystrobinivorans TaxID=3350256 RepID=UPI00372AAD04
MSIQKIEAHSPEAQSADLIADNIAKLKAMFPELLTETTQGGKTTATLNVEVLKNLIGDATAADSEEKYGLNWHGKRKARQMALLPSTGTLRPAPDESVDWDTTQNLMIEGDNLEVLKLLQKSYAGKVKLIYIDPPYNTGKDFVYPDNFQDNIKNYLELTGQTAGGAKITTNTEASGRFHTDWLNMMYPRLKLAHALLSQDGFIFISLDDGEISNLRAICNEIFGEENFSACISWQKTYSPANDKRGIDAMHDYVLVYARSEHAKVNLLPRTAKQDDAYVNQDNDPRGPWKSVDATRAEHRDYAFYPITTPSGREVYPAQGRSWVFTKEELPALLADGRLWFGKDGSSKPSKKLFLTEVKRGVVPTTWWTHEDAGHNDESKKELKSLFQDGLPFDTPKPTRLIRRILQIATSAESDDLVLDFFAGSGTTGQAVFDQNAEDGGKRRFVLVQLPEPAPDRPIATLSGVTRERLKRVSARIKDATPINTQDLGFRSFRLDTSNIRPWNPDSQDMASTLLANLEHIEPGRSNDDVLYEVLLKLGLDLCVPIEQQLIAGKSVHSIGEGALLACLDEHISVADAEPLALGMAQWREQQGTATETTVVFRDSAFENDVAKSNLAAILEQHGVKHVRSL